jgi:hypothetical protein
MGYSIVIWDITPIVKILDSFGSRYLRESPSYSSNPSQG